MAEKRLRQISSDIREHVATLLATGRLSDPRLRGVTIIEVKVTPDLQMARVYFSVLENHGASRVDVQNGFKSAAGFLRKSLGEVLKLRYTPQLMFHFDETLARANRINEVLGGVRREREELGEPGAGSDVPAEVPEK